MSELKFVAIYVPEQNPKTGEIVMDHITNKLQSSVFFSEPFNLRAESELKRTINKIRKDIFSRFIRQENEKLPKAYRKAYIVGKPKTIPDLFAIRNHVVIPVEVKLDIPDDEEVEENEQGYFDPLLKAKVIDVNILSSKICNHRKSYLLWESCEFGQKEKYFQKKTRKVKQEKQKVVELKQK